jgi:response regulator RpfG family c-di-GMP phosphodiesterase
MQNGEMTTAPQRTVLVIHHDAAVLVFLRGILAQHNRVLLATDAESAVRLAMLDVPIDLALVGRNTPGTRNTRELHRRLTSIRPELKVLAMVGCTDDAVIKVRLVGTRAHAPDGFLGQVDRVLRAPVRRRYATHQVSDERVAPKPVKVPNVAVAAHAGTTLQ